MTVTFGFYNSINHDRLYDATQMSSLFDGIINDGIFASLGTALAIRSSSGMNVVVGAGRAWFNSSWLNNDTEFILELDPTDLVLDRIDVIVLEINSTSEVRENSIKYIAGLPATEPVAPELENTDLVHQYPLAYISVPVGTSAITPELITNKVGTVDCPFVTAILETTNIDFVFAQWAGEFGIWFDEMKDQLSTDAAGNLQLQIDALARVHTGAIYEFGQTNIPVDWLPLSIKFGNRTTHANLFSVIGTKYGDGDGSTTFGLPKKYDKLGEWLIGPTLPDTVYDHTTTLLPDGRILVCGGTRNGVRTAQTWFGTINGNSISWIRGTDLPEARTGHAAVLLPVSGKIAIICGANSAGTSQNSIFYGTITENTISWISSTTNLGARKNLTADILSNGNILITGGYITSSASALTWISVEFNGALSVGANGTVLPAARHKHTLCPLPNGDIMVIAGALTTASLDTVWIGHTPPSGGTTIAWSNVTPNKLPAIAQFLSSGLLPDGRVLVCGGIGPTANVAVPFTYVGTVRNDYVFWEDGPLMSAQLMQEYTNGLYGHSQTLLPDGRILILGGANNAERNWTLFLPLIIPAIKI